MIKRGTNRRQLLAAGCSLLLLSACGRNASNQANPKTKVILIGAIHQGHVISGSYSLAILEDAVRKTAPDQIFTEIPPDRLAKAEAEFHMDGAVTEERVAVFPEYRDMLFPLARELDFDIIPVAGWTQQMADNRTAALKRIKNDPARAQEWAEHQEAQSAFNKTVKARRDDPAFIHSAAYDALVEKAQTPYQKNFDEDLGAGGWTEINASHYALIDAQLDKVTGQGKTVMIIFGAWHKYMFLKELEKRSDIELIDPVPLLTG